MQNSQNEIDSFAKQFIYMKANQLIGKYGFTRSDIEDITQELFLDLVRNRPRFDPSKSRWTTFVWVVVNRRIADLIEYQSDPPRDYSREERSLNELFTSEDGEQIEFGESLSSDEYASLRGRLRRSEIESMCLAADLDRVISRLPPELMRPSLFAQQKPGKSQNN